MSLAAPIAVLAAYLLGGLTFHHLLTRGGRPPFAARGLLGLALDLGKGYAAVWLAGTLLPPATPWRAGVSLAVIVGHVFPLYFRFRGGRGVAPAVGAFAYLTPWAVASVVALGLLAVAVWRYLSLGAILGAAAYPVFAYALYRPGVPVLLAAAAAASLLIIEHADNIRRLVTGTEPRLGQRPGEGRGGPGGNGLPTP